MDLKVIDNFLPENDFQMLVNNTINRNDGGQIPLRVVSTVENWETFLLTPNSSTKTAVIDWSSGTWGDAKIHEVDLNQDLDGDGNIWSRTSSSFLSGLSHITENDVRTDVKGAVGKLDSDKNLYIVSVDGNTTREVLDQGALTSFDYSYSGSDYSFSEKVYAVKEIDRNTSDSNSVDAYKVLIKGTETYDSSSSTYYSTVNVNIDNPSSISSSSLSVDWSTFAYYDEPKQLEKLFDISGIY